jgi:hypothetical protein
MGFEPTTHCWASDFESIAASFLCLKTASEFGFVPVLFQMAAKRRSVSGYGLPLSIQSSWEM